MLILSPTSLGADSGAAAYCTAAHPVAMLSRDELFRHALAAADRNKDRVVFQRADIPVASLR